MPNKLEAKLCAPKTQDQSNVGDGIAANLAVGLSPAIRRRASRRMCESPFPSTARAMISFAGSRTILSATHPRFMSLAYRPVRAPTGKLASRHAGKSARFIGIDFQEAMIAQAKKEMGEPPNVELHVEDINMFDYKPSDLIVAYYTMQFIPPRDRQALFDRIYQALNWGGAFIVFEKVRAPDARFQDIMVTLYNEFKLANGFSPEEILTKTRSLKGILEPFSTEGNYGLLSRAGFVEVFSPSSNIFRSRVFSRSSD